MLAVFRRRLRAEEGISLVEVLVSIVLMGLVLAALGNTLFTSMAAARQNEGLTTATAIANEHLERMQAMRWGDLNPAGMPPVANDTRNGRTYTINRQVAWAEPTNTHYKSYWVIVSWTENAKPHTVRVDGRRARRAGESSTPITTVDPFRVLFFTVNPDPVNLDTADKTLPSTNPTLPGNAAMMIEVELSEAARAGSVIVTWPTPSPTQTLTLSEVAGSAGKKWSGTVPSGQTYAPGWLPFRVTAAKAGTSTTCSTTPLPASADCAESTTAAYMLAPVQNGPLYYDSNDQRLYTGTPGPAGDRLCLNSSTARLRNNNSFYLGLKGLSTDDTMVLRRTDVAGVQFPMAWTKVQQSWWWYGDAVSNSAGTFTTGVNSSWEIRWTRSYDGLSGTIPLTFHIQNANGNSPC